MQGAHSQAGPGLDWARQRARMTAQEAAAPAGAVQGVQGSSGDGDKGTSTQAAAGDWRQPRVQSGLTGISVWLEQGGSAAVGTAAMVAQGAGARGCGGSGGQGTAAGAQVG